jgi:hypothetical protein
MKTRNVPQRIVLTHALLVLCLSAGAAESRDPYGGWPVVRGHATGFFHAEQIDGVWWLITPDGQAFLSKGVNHVQYNGDFSPKLGHSPYNRMVSATYGSALKWAEASVTRMRGWGLNTVGAWSSQEACEQRMPYAFLAGLGEGAGAEWQFGKVADVFSPRFAEAVRQKAQRVCTPRARDPFLLGYFTDNELRWGPDWRSKKSLFEEFLGGPEDTPGKQAAVRLLQARYPTAESFNEAWGTELKSLDELPKLTVLPMTNAAAKEARSQFLSQYARAYFQICREGIKAADPNHLILGCRFAGFAPPEVMEAMAEFLDVVSFNNYDFAAPTETLTKLHAATGKPVMLTEFSFKAADSGLPNTKGAGRALPTQQDRADHFERYVTGLARLPFMVGYHWFEYCDEPAEGRFDGENSNYGLVNLKDEPWTVLVTRVQEVNERLEEIHRQAAKKEGR